MEKIIIYAIDIDDCLALEYYLIPKSNDKYQIAFRGELYNHLKHSITTHNRQYGVNFAAFISSISARQSLLLDSGNSKRNGIVSSCLLLKALAEQLYIETKAQIYLDRSLLVDVIGVAAATFDHIICSPLVALEGDDCINAITIPNLVASAQLLTETENEKRSSQNDIKILQCNRYLKLFRARHILSCVKQFLSLPDMAKIEFHMYDDVEHYLRHIQQYLTVKNLCVELSTFWIEPYYRYRHIIDGEDEYLLDRSLVLALTEKEKLAQINWSTSHIVQNVHGQFTKMQNTFRELQLSKLYIEKLKQYAQEQQDIPTGSQALFFLSKTVQDVHRTDGFSWGRKGAPAYSAAERVLKDKLKKQGHDQ